MKEVILMMSILSMLNGQVDTATATDGETLTEYQTASTEQSDDAAPFDMNVDEEPSVAEPIVDVGQIVDDRLYLSREYTDKDINDCYSMLLSIRNCVILLNMTIFLFKAYEIMSKEFKKHFKA